MNCPHGDPSCPCQDGDPCHYEPTATTKAFPCPHCHKPIPDAELLKVAPSLLARRNKGKPRPGARGMIRNPAGRNGKEGKVSK